MNEKQVVQADSISRAAASCPAVNFSNLAQHTGTLKLEPVRRDSLSYLFSCLKVSPFYVSPFSFIKFVREKFLEASLQHQNNSTIKNLQKKKKKKFHTVYSATAVKRICTICCEAPLQPPPIQYPFALSIHLLPC